MVVMQGRGSEDVVLSKLCTNLDVRFTVCVCVQASVEKSWLQCCTPSFSLQIPLSWPSPRWEEEEEGEEGVR